MKVSDFDYHLPSYLIARYPTKDRTGSRLLHLNASTGDIRHMHFRDIIDLIEPKDLMVFNNTQVIPARFFGRKDSGGKVEILLERVIDQTTALAQVRASKGPKPGGVILLDDGAELSVLDRSGEFFRLAFPSGVLATAKKLGRMPLPPYLERQEETSDLERYQTVYASQPGAVAAPTAGLHFDQSLLDRISKKGVTRAELTLHVGAGTFQPVRVEKVTDHHMHHETIEVSEGVCLAVDEAKKRQGRVIAVGTTSVRSLEAVSASGKPQPYSGDTDIFIYPGYEFRSVDAMVTNFHLPGSTLMMLVSAFAGHDNIMKAYACAIEESYRFFSYGDSMLITR